MQNTELTNNFLTHFHTVDLDTFTSTKSVREKAEEKLKNFSIPNRKNEEWKYTNIASVLQKPFTGNQNTTLEKKDIQNFLIPNTQTIVFVDGKFSQKLSSENLEENGNTIVCTLLTAEEKYPEIIEQHLQSYKYDEHLDDIFRSLNTAYFQDGCFVYVKQNSIAEKLIHILNIHTSNVLVQPRNLIVAEQNAQCSVVESYVSIGSETAFSNTLTEIVALQDAIVHHYKIQNENSKSSQVNNTHIKQFGKSTTNSYVISTGGKITRNNLTIVLEQEYCEANLYGLYPLSGNQHVDNHTLVDHASPNCNSNELYKGIMRDSSTAVFNGKIFVRKDAQKTNAFQNNRNILLSDKATVNTKPQLEIFADDVKCSHGCTTGQLDTDAMFYLQARGISKEEARKILLDAFISDITNEIENEDICEYFEGLINK